MKSFFRALNIARIASAYGLEQWLPASKFRWAIFALKILLPTHSAHKKLSQAARLRLALQELGPLFVKLGQVLSTRRDVLPEDVAIELANLRDRVTAFDSTQAREIIEHAFNKPITELFAHFENEPLASASIAQVHAAQLLDGRDVVVKVLRPTIESDISRDIACMRMLAALINRLHPHADKIRLMDVVTELESTLLAECDLQREAANASYMQRLWQGSAQLSVPEVLWSHTQSRVLCMQRVYGIPADDIKALDSAGIDRKQLAAEAVRILYTQVFRDNFFHADAHAGNIWVDVSRAPSANFIALDFGIVGQLSQQDQYYLAENFMAIFNKDYQRIAQLHVQAGWMPASIRIEELEAAVRAVCEPYFTRPLSEFSIAEVAVKLLRTAQKYQLTLQPQLILLQKTLLNTEGLARTLDPNIDIWAVAKPILENILRTRYSPQALLEQAKKQWPEFMHSIAQMPELILKLLQQHSEGKTQLIMRSDEIAQLVTSSQRNQRQLFGLCFGFASAVSASIFSIAGTHANWMYGLVIMAILSFAFAWPKRA